MKIKMAGINIEMMKRWLLLIKHTVGRLFARALLLKCTQYVCCRCVVIADGTFIIVIIVIILGYYLLIHYQIHYHRWG